MRSHQLQFSFIADWSLWLFAASKYYKHLFRSFCDFYAFQIDDENGRNSSNSRKFIHCIAIIHRFSMNYARLHTRIALKRLPSLRNIFALKCLFLFVIFNFYFLLSISITARFVPHKSFNCSTMDEMSHRFFFVNFGHDEFAVFTVRVEQLISHTKIVSKKAQLHRFLVCGSVH